MNGPSVGSATKQAEPCCEIECCLDGARDLTLIAECDDLIISKQNYVRKHCSKISGFSPLGYTRNAIYRVNCEVLHIQ